MICKYCNTNVDSKEKICPHCGQPLRKETLPGRVISSLRQMPARNWLCVIVLVLAFLIAASFLTYNFRPGPFSSETATINCLTEGERNTFFYNGKRLEDTVDGTLYGVNTSMYGDVMVFMNEKSLYCVGKKGLKLISDNVVTYQMASYGGKVAYLNSVNELYLYTCSSGKAELVDYNVLGSNLCVSSGGTIAYLKSETTGDVMYYYTGSKPEKYSAGRYPVSVSDGARTLYTVDGSMNLYCSVKGKEVQVFENVGNTFVFDNDYTDVLFISSGKSYVYDGKNSAKLIAQGSVSLIGNNDIASHSNNLLLSDDTVSVSYGISSFSKKFFIDTEGTLYYADKKYKVTECDQNVSDPVVTDNGKRVFYLREGMLKRCGASDMAESVLSENITAFQMSGDGRYLYFTDSDGTLFGKHGRLRAKKIAENVLALSESGRDCLFYTVTQDSGRSLYGMKDMSSPKLLHADVGEYNVYAGSAYYAVGNEYYFSNANLKFKNIYTKTK